MIAARADGQRRFPAPIATRPNAPPRSPSAACKFLAVTSDLAMLRAGAAAALKVIKGS